MRTLTFAPAGVAFMFLALAALGEEPTLRIPPGSPKLQLLDMGEAREEIHTRVSTATGQVTYDEDAIEPLEAPVSGRISRLLVQAGARVRQGQPLLAIDSPDVEAARAEAIQARSDLEAAQRALEHAQFNEATLPRGDVESAQAELTEAQATADRAQARLDSMGLDAHTFSSSYTLRAPHEATVIALDVTAGTEVHSGMPLVTLGDPGRLWVVASIPERDLARAQEGDPAEIRVPSYPAEVFKGKVVHGGARRDATAGTVQIDVAVVDAEGRLKPEGTARVTLLRTDAQKVTTIPLSALLLDGNHMMVIVSPNAGEFVERTVEVGPAQAGGRIQVIRGLEAGERVVVKGGVYVKSELDLR